jgi:hypothetical protein
VFGTIHYRAPGRMTQIECDSVQFLRPRDELPRAIDIVDANFTSGLTSEEYLERLRNGDFA